MKIVKYTEKVKDVLGLKLQPQPWLHCGVFERVDGKCTAFIWVWDTRKVVAIEQSDTTYADFEHRRLALTPDNHMPLKGLPKSHEMANVLFGFNKYDAERMRAYLDGLK